MWSQNGNVINAHQYYVDDIDLEHVQHIKDLGIIFDVELNFILVKRLTGRIQYVLLLKETSDVYPNNLFYYVI